MTVRRRREVLALDPVLVDEAARKHWAGRQLTPVLDAKALDWIDEQLIGFSSPASDPHTVFEASVRLGNPASDETFDDLPGDVKNAVTSALAAATATVESAVLCVWEGYGYPWSENLSSLASVAPVGADPGPLPWPAFPAAIRQGPKAILPGSDRKFVVLTGPVFALDRIGWDVTNDWVESRWPDVAYPADRAWLSYSDIDDDTIDIHGSLDLIEHLRRIDGLTVELRWPC